MEVLFQQETQGITNCSPEFNEHFCCKSDFLANQKTWLPYLWNQSGKQTRGPNWTTWNLRSVLHILQSMKLQITTHWILQTITTFKSLNYTNSDAVNSSKSLNSRKKPASFILSINNSGYFHFRHFVSSVRELSDIFFRCI